MIVVFTNQLVADMDCLDQFHRNTPTGSAEEAHDVAAARFRQKAIWIASYHKSGNTWVRVFIHNLTRELADRTKSIEGGERRVHEFMGSWSFHAASWISVQHRPVLILRYEDMLAAPERTFGRHAGFLRLQPSAEQLWRAIEKSSFAELARQEEGLGFVERPQKAERFFWAGTSGQWKEALSSPQVKAVVEAHAPMMMRFGYLREVCCG